MTTYPDGTIVYTPYPDYEMVDPSGIGANTVRTTYRVAGQIVAVQTKVGSAAGVFRYTYTDHLGNIVALSQGNSYVGGSLARYDPFGNYRTTPDESVNPDISNHGFTGHRMNNTGEFPIEKVGLIYMNARYYLPEVGRFISPDTIVPDPGNPQSYNRYSYTRNNPVNFTDPTGHREIGMDENDILPHEAPSPNPIWTEPFLDGGPDWVQPPGQTTFGVIEYPKTSGIHTGMDWGKDIGYFTDDPFQFAVRAGCECVVEAVSAPPPTDPYRPWRVDLVSTKGEYSDYLLIYGHLAEVQVSVGQTISSATIIGYLETSEFHVHIEIRRKSDNAYINPWRYLAPSLQSQMQGLIHEDTFVPGGRLGYPPSGHY